MSDEEKFLSERGGISNNSMERASKQLFMHQQKMLKKHAENLRKFADHSVTLAGQVQQIEEQKPVRRLHSKKR